MLDLVHRKYKLIPTGSCEGSIDKFSTTSPHVATSLREC